MRSPTSIRIPLSCTSHRERRMCKAAAAARRRGGARRRAAGEQRRAPPSARARARPQARQPAPPTSSPASNRGRPAQQATPLPCERGGICTPVRAHAALHMHARVHQSARTSSNAAHSTQQQPRVWPAHRATARRCLRHPHGGGASCVAAAPITAAGHTLPPLIQGAGAHPREQLARRPAQPTLRCAFRHARTAPLSGSTPSAPPHHIAPSAGHRVLQLTAPGVRSPRRAQERPARRTRLRSARSGKANQTRDTRNATATAARAAARHPDALHRHAQPHRHPFASPSLRGCS